MSRCARRRRGTGAAGLRAGDVVPLRPGRLPGPCAGPDPAARSGAGAGGGGGPDCGRPDNLAAVLARRRAVQARRLNAGDPTIEWLTLLLAALLIGVSKA